MSPHLFIPLGEGFFLGLGLIIGFGPQTSFILQQGLRREFLLTVALLASFIDLCLIALGAGGAGSFFAGQPLLVQFVTWAGVAFLGVYGWKSFRNAFSPHPLARLESGHKLGKVAVISTLLAVTLLNPTAYLDTLLIIGGGATRYEASLRVVFALGATLASVVWFFSLAFGAAKLTGLLRRPVAVRLFDGLSAAVMWLCATYLLLPAL